MDDKSIKYLHSLAPENLYDLYCQSKQIRDYVDQEYELYSKFWYGAIPHKVYFNGHKKSDPVQDIPCHHTEHVTKIPKKHLIRIPCLGHALDSRMLHCGKCGLGMDNWQPFEEFIRIF
jgi:hypothetical protein